MNEFIEKHDGSMREFLNHISVSLLHKKKTWVLVDVWITGTHSCSWFIHLWIAWKITELFNICSQSANNGNHLLDYDGYIDLGKELSLLHILLTENLEKANQVSTDNSPLLRHPVLF